MEEGCFFKQINYNLQRAPGRAWLMSSRLKIFPAGDLGTASVKATRRIFLYGATCGNKLEASSECIFHLTWMDKPTTLILCNMGQDKIDT